MIRTTACLMILAVLSALSGAQSPGPNSLSSDKRQQLFTRNREVIRTLVDSSVDISNQSGDLLQRSRLYHKVIRKFKDELTNAASNGDADRVAELGNHLNTVMSEGLVPSLQLAHRQVGMNGTGRQDILDMRDRTVELVDWLQDQAKEKWATTPGVRGALEKLEQTKKQLGNSIP